MSGYTPNWSLDYVPSPSEWNNLWASKGDFATAGVTDPSNTSGLGAPAIIRRTVYIDNVAGITFGSGQTQTVQQANATALQAAVTYATTNNYYIEGNSQTIEIYNSTGIVFYPTNFWFHWEGDMQQTIINQANPAAPILVLGDITGAKGTGSSTFKGVWVNYIASPVGNTGAIAVQLGVCSFSLFEKIKVASGINTGTGAFINPPYIGLLIGGSANQFFANTVRDIEVTGGQQYMWLNSLGGTQNLYQNIYLGGGGGAGQFFNTFGSTVPMQVTSGNAQYGDVYEAVAIEWCGGSNLLRFDVANGVTVNGIRFEGCHLTGASPGIFGLLHASVVVNGCQILNQRILTASPDSVTGVANIGGSFDSSSLVINNLSIADTVANVKTATWEMYNESGTGDNFATATFNDISLLNVQGTMQWDGNMPTASFPVALNAQNANKTESYKYRHLFSEVVCAPIYVSVSAYTHYGQYTNAIILCPANPAQAIAITLSNLMRPSGVGSSQHVASRNRTTVRMLAGTNTGGFAVTVTDAVGGLLSTITTPGTTIDYVFDTTTAGQWAIIT